MTKIEISAPWGAPRPRSGLRQLGLAFLGCGWATRLHSRTLARFSREARLYYASRDARKAESFRCRFGGAGAFASYDAALESPDVDVVLVAVPPALHLELTMQALRAGKDVIVEKPAFLRADDVALVAAVQRETRRRVLVAENYFYKPLARILRDVIGSGTLGDVRFVHVNAVKWQATGGWRDRDPALAGGGALFEAGIHWLDLMGNLGLSIVSVGGVRAGGGDGGERSALAVITYAGGAVGTLLYSWEVRSVLGGARLSKIYGTRGSATFESNGAFVLVTGRRPRLYLSGLRDILGYRAMFRDFLHSIRTGDEAMFTLERARDDLELVERIYESMQLREEEQPVEGARV